jgi:hypothetical protein
LYYHLDKGIHGSNSAPSGISNFFTASNKVLQKGYGYGSGPALVNVTRITSTNIKMRYLKRFSQETHLAYYIKKTKKSESNFEFFMVRLY